MNTIEIKQTIAARADMLVARQNREYSETRQREIDALQAAYRILNGFVAGEQLAVSVDKI